MTATQAHAPLTRAPLPPTGRRPRLDLPVIETVICDDTGAPRTRTSRAIDEILHRAELIEWMRAYMRLSDRR